MTQDNSNRKRVLVVEDEPVISRICQRTLTAEGFEVDIAVNGLVAKRMADDKDYDLCLSDIRTPQMNGIELYNYLELEHPKLAHKVIFTTGDVLSNSIDIFLKKVKRPFLAKPFTPDELGNVIKEVFNSEAAPNLPNCLEESLPVESSKDGY
jgi:DNA-binding NtrC family response regulator